MPLAATAIITETVLSGSNFAVLTSAVVLLVVLVISPLNRASGACAE